MIANSSVESNITEIRDVLCRDFVCRDFNFREDQVLLTPFTFSHHCWVAKTPTKSLFLKSYTDHGLNPTARKMRGSSPFQVYSSEPEIYELLTRARFSAIPEFLGTRKLKDGTSVLILENIDGDLLWSFPFGTRNWVRSSHLLAEVGPKLAAVCDQGLELKYRMASGHRLTEILEPAIEGAAPASRDLVALLLKHKALLKDVLEEVEAGPWGWVHGQPYSVNTIVERKSDRVVLADWESLAFAPKLFDLACLLFFGEWTAEGRAAISDAFFSFLPKESPVGLRPGFDRLLCKTELFNQLWLLATIGAGWWKLSHNGTDSALSTYKMVSFCLEGLTHG